jgi:hypothetical protein
MSTGISNRFTVYFGVKNPSNTQIAPSLEARGIPLLRQEPSKATTVVIPDAPQTGYGAYIHALPHFMKAYMTGRKVNLITPTSVLDPTPFDAMITWGLPDVVFGWRFSIANEVVENLRETYSAYDTVGQGRPGMAVSSPDMETVRSIRETNPDMVFPAPYGFSNLTTISTVVVTYRIINQITALQQYPAWMDPQHYTNWSALCVEGSTDQAGDTAMATSDWVESIGTDEGVIPCRGDQWITNLGTDMLPFSKALVVQDPRTIAMGGLWFPYIAELALFDTETVPQVIDRWFLSSLAADTGECVEMMGKVRSDFGLLGKTEWGKSMTHAFKCMDICIRAQGRLKVVMDNGIYLGSCVMGSNFLVEINGQMYRPGSADNLRDAVLLSGSNRLLLRKIARECAAGETEFDNISRMWELRSKISTAGGCSLTSQKEVEKLAMQLRFPEDKSWKPIVHDIAKAASYMDDGTPIVDYPIEERLPITAGSLFVNEKLRVIWSCFGYTAPSFRIPGGAAFDLSAPSNFITRKAGAFSRQTTETLVVSKISLRMVALDQAINDTEMLIREKQALNPFALPNMKRSAANQYKVFTGKDFQKIVDSLRMIARVGTIESTASSKGKRKATGEDHGEGPSRKKTAFDW